MKKLFFVALFILNSSVYAIDWSRENFCPTGDVERVLKIMSTMTIEEKVGQVIMADLDFVKPSDLKKYPLGGILNGEIPHPTAN